MKNLLIAVFTLMFAVGAAAQSEGKMNTKKTLVAYFSCTGVTKSAAQKLAKIVDADSYEIQPEKAYTPEDLDWKNKKSRSSVEMHDTSSRPQIVSKIADFNQYETVFVGFPIWWNLAPTIINTFFESNDFSGKTVVLFATSGSSSISNSETMLQKTYPKIKWKSGKLLNGTIDKSSLEPWLNKIK